MPNIILILFTLFVLKLVISSDSKDIHSLNIHPISVTKEVSKLWISKYFKLEQLLNIFSILIALSVWKFDKFKEINDIQESNI